MLNALSEVDLNTFLLGGLHRVERCFGEGHMKGEKFLSVKGCRASSHFIVEDFHCQLNMTTGSEMVPSLPAQEDYQ